MSRFREEDCLIPEIWCGESSIPSRKKGKLYYKTGTRYECMKKGFGAGMYTEKRSNLPPVSLMKISYVEEKHEELFKKIGIKSTKQLVEEMRLRTSKEISYILTKILKKDNGELNEKAYNSVVLYLYRHGVGGVPKCKKL